MSIEILLVLSFVKSSTVISFNVIFAISDSVTDILLTLGHWVIASSTKTVYTPPLSILIVSVVSLKLGSSTPLRSVLVHEKL